MVFFNNALLHIEKHSHLGAVWCSALRSVYFIVGLWMLQLYECLRATFSYLLCLPTFDFPGELRPSKV